MERAVMTRNQIRYAAVAVIAAVIVAAGYVGIRASGVFASPKPAVNTIGSPGIAIKGYDPVAYFKDGGPRKGSKEFSAKYKGATWYFANADNKAAFTADPEKYAPVYGGYCAYGVAKGSLVKIEPEAWSIKNGRLYLNYDLGVQKTWAEDPQGYIAKADKLWPKLIGAK